MVLYLFLLLTHLHFIAAIYCDTLLISPSTDKTSVVYLLRSLHGNALHLHFFFSLLYFFFSVYCGELSKDFFFLTLSHSESQVLRICSMERRETDRTEGKQLSGYVRCIWVGRTKGSGFPQGHLAAE